MITELYLKNYVLISDLRLKFGEGMIALTGETGAGKSLIVGALNLIFGKSNSTQIFYNPELPVFLEITITIPSDCIEINTRLSEIGLAIEEPELIIAREFYPNGKSTCYLNGKKTSVSVLKDLYDLFIDFHHQREQQKILNPIYQMEILDRYGQLLPDRLQYQAYLCDLKDKLSKLEQIKKIDEQNRKLYEIYLYQYEELENASLNDNEDIILEEQYDLLSHAEEITHLANDYNQKLYEQDNSVYDILNQLRSQLSKYSDNSEIIDMLLEKTDFALDSIQEIAYQLRNLTIKIGSDPSALDKIRDRLDEINRLKVKYHVSNVEELLSYKKNIKFFIESYQKDIEIIRELQLQIDEVFNRLLCCADILTKKRRETATILAKELETNLRKLSIPDAKVEIQIDKKTDSKIILIDFELYLNEYGQDKVEFMFSANQGMPLQPLKSVASGGELSRFLLVAKKTLWEILPAKVVILDEIDSGIGGKTAEAMADFIYSMSTKYQLFCITHLARIASRADEHYLIEKSVENNNTKIKVKQLNQNERINEIARMLSGETTKLSYEHAKELLNIIKR